MVGSIPPSELQIWRRTGQDYTKVGFTQLRAQNSTNYSNVYEYIPPSPLGFQEGDILGVYQRTGSSIVPYYQESTGPENLRQSGLLSSAPNSFTAPPLAAEYDYPLVTVEIGEFCALLIVCRTTFLFCYIRFSNNKYHTGPLDYYYYYSGHQYHTRFINN